MCRYVGQFNIGVYRNSLGWTRLLKFGTTHLRISEKHAFSKEVSVDYNDFRHQLGAILSAEFFHQSGTMYFHGPVRNNQLAGDFLAGQAVHNMG
ncbi:hypothetical protein D3C76_1247880 [compost metagenome]